MVLEKRLDAQWKRSNVPRILSGTLPPRKERPRFVYFTPPTPRQVRSSQGLFSLYSSLEGLNHRPLDNGFLVEGITTRGYYPDRSRAPETIVANQHGSREKVRCAMET